MTGEHLRLVKTDQVILISRVKTDHMSFSLPAGFAKRTPKDSQKFIQYYVIAKSYEIEHLVVVLKKLKSVWYNIVLLPLICVWQRSNFLSSLMFSSDLAYIFLCKS
jgi:hypothetical protein